MRVLVVLDCETGGLSANDNPITQIAWQVLDYSTLKSLDTYSTFVKPYAGLKIEDAALKATMLSMKQIQEQGIIIRDVVDALIQINKKYNPKNAPRIRPVFVGHNFTFDIKFLEQAFMLHKQDIYSHFDEYFFDTLRMIMLKENEPKNVNKLEIVCERYGIKLKDAHGAAADVEATKLLFKEITKSLRHGAGSDDDGRLVGADEAGERRRNSKYFEF